MSQPDRQTKSYDGKFTRWSLGAVYENQYKHLDKYQDKLPDIVKRWGWQDEICPKTGRKHRQGFLLCFAQQRRTALNKVLPGIHLEGIPFGAKGPKGGDRWQGLLDYCEKPESRDPNSVAVDETNTKEHVTMEQALTMLAEYSWSLKVFDTNKKKANEYWSAVSQILETKPNLVGVYASPQMEKVWVNTRMVWINKWQREPIKIFTDNIKDGPIVIQEDEEKSPQKQDLQDGQTAEPQATE